MESYSVLADGYIRRGSDKALIPPTVQNKDYVKYLQDVSAGAVSVMCDDVSTEDAIAESVQRRIDERLSLLARMKDLEDKIYYSQLTGDIDPVSGRPWADVKKDAWLVLRQQLINLEAGCGSAVR